MIDSDGVPMVKPVRVRPRPSLRGELDRVHLVGGDGVGQKRFYANGTFRESSGPTGYRGDDPHYSRRLEMDRVMGHDTTTSEVFTLEARVRPDLYVTPVLVGKMLVDERWHEIGITQVPDGCGVRSRLYSAEALARGYLSYESAMSIGWAFLADCPMDSVEVRLVQHEFVVKTEHKRVRELSPIHSYTLDRAEILRRAYEEPQADAAVARTTE